MTLRSSKDYEKITKGKKKESRNSKDYEKKKKTTRKKRGAFEN